MSPWWIKFLSSIVDLLAILTHPFSKLRGGRICILCYHRVFDLPETDDIMASLYVSPAILAQQMAFLLQNGFSVITLEQLIDYKDNGRKPPPKAVVITFDDGYRDNYLNAIPVLNTYGFKGTFFLASDYINSDTVFPWLKLGEKSRENYQQNREYWLPLRQQDILDMSANGNCFGSHTMSHCSLLNGVGSQQGMAELAGSKKILERILGKPVRCFCYPYGHVSKAVKEWVREAGYRAAVAGAGSNTMKSDFLELRRSPIFNQDSLAKFARKVEGGYDWIWYMESLVRSVFNRK